MGYPSQRDKRWGNKTLGKTNLKMADWGCFVTSLSILSGLSPDATLEALNKANAFDSEGRIYSDIASKALGLKYNGKTKSPPSGKAVPCIVECDISEKVGIQQHFCVYLGKLNGKPVIIDPWDGEEKFCLYTIVSYRLFQSKVKLKISDKLLTEVYPAKPIEEDKDPKEIGKENLKQVIREDILNNKSSILKEALNKKEERKGLFFFFSWFCSLWRKKNA